VSFPDMLVMKLAVMWQRNRVAPVFCSIMHPISLQVADQLH
jgi:hypothetical protein